MALSTLSLISLIITLFSVFIAMVLTLWYRAKSTTKKCKTVLSWIAVTTLALFFWTIFHLSLDVELFPSAVADIIHYWVVHSFIIIVVIILANMARMIHKMH